MKFADILFHWAEGGYCATWYTKYIYVNKCEKETTNNFKDI